MLFSVTLAVLSFETPPGEEWVGEMLVHILTTELFNIPGIKVLEREGLKHILEEYKLYQLGLISRDSFLLSIKNAEYLIWGIYTSYNGNFFIAGKLVKVKTGEILYETTTDGPRNELIPILKRLAVDIAVETGYLLSPEFREKIKAENAPALPEIGDKEMAEYLNERAHECYLREDYEKALFYYRASLEINPEQEEVIKEIEKIKRLKEGK